MTTSRRLVAATAAALPLVLLAGHASAAEAKREYLPAKNTVYSGGGLYPDALFTGTARIKVGGDKRVLTKVVVKVSCPEGDDKVVYKKVRYRHEAYHFHAVKRSRSKPAYELYVQFATKRAASGDLWLYDGPCDGHRLGFVADR